jgi:hypothetical protein
MVKNAVVCYEVWLHQQTRKDNRFSNEGVDDDDNVYMVICQSSGGIHLSDFGEAELELVAERKLEYSFNQNLPDRWSKDSRCDPNLISIIKEHGYKKCFILTVKCWCMRYLRYL